MCNQWALVGGDALVRGVEAVLALGFSVGRWHISLLDRRDRTSMAVDVEWKVSFCDHWLVEYMFNIFGR